MLRLARSVLGSTTLLSCSLIGGCMRSPSPHNRPASGVEANGKQPLAKARDAPDPQVAGAAPGVAQKHEDERHPTLPLVAVVDAPLPGHAVRFDYQALDADEGHLVIAHMNDASVVIVNASDGSLVKVVGNVPRPRGVAVAGEARRIFVTSSPNTLVILDGHSLAEIARVRTGSAPDGVGWDPVHRLVAVSDQGDGALSLIGDAGSGARRVVKLGEETGNVVFDRRHGAFWVTVVSGRAPDELVRVDPLGATVGERLPLPGCSGAHGLLLHPDGASAFVACEGNAKLARVALADRSAETVLAECGEEPDVLAVDPALAWLYVAAESGDVRVFDVGRPGLVALGREQPGHAAHSVAVDPKTHRVYFPLERGPAGAPILRIMKPSGT